MMNKVCCTAMIALGYFSGSKKAFRAKAQRRKGAKNEN